MTNIIETWAKIEGYPNYSISTLGNVRNDKTATIRKKSLGLRGYYTVSINKNCETKTMTIHRLMAIAFIPRVEGAEFVDHIDRNRQNNTLDNLRWVTKKGNQQNMSKYNRGNNTSNFRGVSWDKNRNKWTANISINGKRKSLGRFNNELEAHQAHEAARLAQYHIDLDIKNNHIDNLLFDCY